MQTELSGKDQKLDFHKQIEAKRKEFEVESLKSIEN